MVKYFHLIFGTDKEYQLLGKYIINICKNIYLSCTKVGLKFLNFYSFILDKEKNTSKGSLKLGDFKNIYSSRHIFNIFPFIRRFLARIIEKLKIFLGSKCPIQGVA